MIQIFDLKNTLNKIFFLVCGKELHSLTPLQLSGFRLHPGPLPEQYRHSMIVQTKRKKSKKTKNRHKGSETPATDDQNATGSRNDSEEREKRKEKKHKKHEKGKHVKFCEIFVNQYLF